MCLWQKALLERRPNAKICWEKITCLLEFCWAVRERLSLSRGVELVMPSVLLCTRFDDTPSGGVLFEP